MLLLSSDEQYNRRKYLDCSELEFLLDMDGIVHFYENKYWYKINVKRIEASTERPHGIKYELTFHNQHNERIFGMDNAHFPEQNRYKARVLTYDHYHKTIDDKGTPYEFTTAYKLIEDFFTSIHKIMELSK